MGRGLAEDECRALHVRLESTLSSSLFAGRAFCLPTTEYKGTGALRGLIGKTGAKPARSRHCNGERTHDTPLGRKSWEGLGKRGSVSQENCLFESHRYYLRAMGRGLHLCVLPTSGVEGFPHIAEAFLFCGTTFEDSSRMFIGSGRVINRTRRWMEGLG